MSVAGGGCGGGPSVSMALPGPSGHQAISVKVWNDLAA